MQPIFDNVPPGWTWSQRRQDTRAYHLWEGVRTRRFVAFCLDLALLGSATILMPFVVALLLVPLGLAAGIVGFGLSWLIIPPLVPLLAFFYNGVTVSGRSRGTPGMRAMGLEIRHVKGGRLPFLNAGVHAVLLYVSWMFPIVFLVSFFTGDKAFLHDVIAQARVMRRLG